MKRKDIFYAFLLLPLFVSCLKDEGNYDYAPVSGPTFYFKTPAHLYCYEGDTTYMTGKFRYETPDSLERMADVRCEWEVNGVVLSDEKDFNVPTSVIIEKLGLKEFPSGFLAGTFAVIQKSTGMRYLHRIFYNVLPKFSRGQWLILSEDGGGSKLSYQRFFLKNNGNKTDSIFENYPGIYRQNNNGETLPGRPVKLVDHGAPYISASAAATLVVTDQVAFELNNERFTKAKDLKDEFADGTPGNFKVKDAFYEGTVTFLATQDGRLFRRLFSENYLGGKFMTEPYVVDARGYKADFFGYGQKSNFISMRVLYDRENHRVLGINLHQTPKGAVYPLTPVEGNYPVNVWDMGEDTEVLALGEMNAQLATYDQILYCMIYNEAGKTYMADFVVDNKPPFYYANVVNTSNNNKKEFPGGTLDKESLFWIPAAYGSGQYISCVFYTKGNELRYIDRAKGTDHLFMPAFADKITAIHVDLYNSYKEIAVGLANGDFMRVNMRDKTNPRIIEKSKFNVGGKIVSLSNTGAREYYSE